MSALRIEVLLSNRLQELVAYIYIYIYAKNDFSNSKGHFLNASFSDEVILRMRKLVILLFPFFCLHSHVFFKLCWEWEKKVQGRRDLAKHQSTLFLLHQSRKTVPLRQHHLKPKTKPKVCRRGVEKRRKREGKVENGHLVWTFLSPTVVANTGSSVPAGGDGWGATEAREGRAGV